MTRPKRQERTPEQPPNASRSLPVKPPREVEAQLVLLHEAVSSLALVRDFSEAKKIRDRARAWEVYLRARTDAMEGQRLATRLRLCAEWHMGRLLPKKVDREESGRKGGRGRKVEHDVRPLGSTEVHRLRLLASIPERAFKDELEKGEVSAKRLRGLAKTLAVEEKTEKMSRRTTTVKDLRALARSVQAGERPGFDIILADPPWEYQSWTKVKDGAASASYSTMDHQSISDEIPVSDLAAKDCALVMWATWPKLPEALKVMEAWSFRYVTGLFVWDKTYRDGSPYCGMGFYTRSGTEFCLLGLRGSMPRATCDVRQVLKAPVGRHSEKPVEIYSRIEALWPEAEHRIELFARNATPGWVAWGNEIERTLFDGDPIDG